MGNEDLTKLARWVIPGWVMLFMFFVFVLTDSVICSKLDSDGRGKIDTYIRVSVTASNKQQLTLKVKCKDKTLWDILRGWFQRGGNLSAAVLAALLTVSGVPLGFIIYQLYFFTRWNTPYSRDGFLSLMPGRMHDLEHSLRGIPEEWLIIDDAPWRYLIVKQHPLFQWDHRFRWRYIESLFTEVTQRLSNDLGNRFYEYHRYLHRIVHILGASIFATFTAFSAYLIFKYLFHWSKLQGFYSVFLYWIEFALGALGVLTWLLYKENENKFSAYRKELTTDADLDLHHINPLPFIEIKALKGKMTIPYPSFLFLFVLGWIHLLCNPAFFTYTRETEPPNILAFFALTASVVIFTIALFLHLFIMPANDNIPNIPTELKKKLGIWRQSAKKFIVMVSSGLAFIFFVRLYLFFFSKILVVAKISHQIGRIVGLFPWDYLFVLYIFLIIYYILHQNRQNARGDMLEVENYIFSMYFHQVGKSEERKPNESYGGKGKWRKC